MSALGLRWKSFSTIPDKKLKELDDALAKKLKGIVAAASDLRIYSRSAP